MTLKERNAALGFIMMVAQEIADAWDASEAADDAAGMAAASERTDLLAAYTKTFRDRLATEGVS